MKALKSLFILLLVIALLGTGLYFVLQHEPGGEISDPQKPQMYMYQTDINDIICLSVTSPNGAAYYLQKIEDKWVLNSDPTLAVSQSKVNTLAYQAANISAVELVAENTTDFAEYRLDNPRRSIMTSLNDGTEQIVVIGASTDDGSLCYAMVQGENKVYTKLSATCDDITPQVDQLFDTSLYSMNPEDISRISIEKNGARPISLQKNPAENVDGKTTYEWEMLAPLQKTTNDVTISDNLLKPLSNISASRAIPYPKKDVDYGFTEPRAKFTVSNSDSSQAYTVIVGAETEKNSYVKLDNATLIYEIPSETLSFLQLNYLEFVDKTILIEKITEVSGIHLSGLGKDYRISILDAEKEYSINGKTIPEKTFKTVYEAIVGITMDDFTETNPGGEAVVFSIVYDKTNGKQSKLEFVSYDARNYRATVNGQGNLLVRQKKLDNLISLIEKTLAE